MTRYITGIAFSSQHTELIIYIWLSVRRRRRRNPLSVPLSDLTHSGKDLETLAHRLTGSRLCSRDICVSSRFFFLIFAFLFVLTAREPIFPCATLEQRLLAMI